MTDIKTVITDYSTRFNQKAAQAFPKPIGPEKRVIDAMEYSLLNGGKRLRPYLVYETARLFGKDFTDSINAALALEMLHTYSLIHDDLPAMDNDDLRRGKPTCHKQFDEATAILAGDGLLTYAFEQLAKAPYSDEIKIKLINLLARGAGAYDGMIAGQMLDLYAETVTQTPDPIALIRHIEEMKTGRLLSYACQAGAVIGGATDVQYEILTEYSRCIGIAFQIADDILDVEGDEKLVGKTLKKDAAQNKFTFVSCYGLNEAKKIASDLIVKAQGSIAAFGEKSVDLQNLAQFIIDRKY